MEPWIERSAPLHSLCWSAAGGTRYETVSTYFVYNDDFGITSFDSVGGYRVSSEEEIGRRAGNFVLFGLKGLLRPEGSKSEIEIFSPDGSYSVH